MGAPGVYRSRAALAPSSQTLLVIASRSGVEEIKGRASDAMIRVVRRWPTLLCLPPWYDDPVQAQAQITAAETIQPRTAVCRHCGRPTNEALR